MAKRLAELGALQDAVSNSESNPSRLGLAGYIRGLFLDWSANPYNPLTRLSARGRLLGYFWDNGAVVLSMDFANQSFIVKDGTLQSKPFSDIVNFSRTSNATVTNSAGVIAYAPHNLLTFSEQFDNAAWIKTTTTVTANAIASPTSTTTGDTLTASGANSTTLHSYTAIAQPYTFSIYIRRRTGTGNIQITADGSTYVTKTITSDWTRFDTTITPTAGTRTPGVRIVTSGDAIDVWGAQLEIGSTATTYNSTTVKNLLGFSELFDNAAWTKSNSFVQTNLLNYTEDCDNAYWTKNNATIVANSIISPNGYQTADTVTSTATSLSYIYRNNVGTLTNGQTYTLSRYVKAGTKAFCTLGLFGLADAYFDLNNLTYSFTGTGAVSASIADVGNGWRRMTATWTWGTGTTYSAYFAIASSLSSQAGLTIGDTIYTWGAQLVQGSVAGDYRRTDAASLPVYYPNHNGVVCAEKFVVGATTGQHYMTRAAITGLTTGANQTISIYAKAGERDWLLMYVGGGGSGTATAYFNLATGTLGTVSGGITSANCQIIASGNGYYRCSITTSPVSTSLTPEFHAVAANNGISNTGDGTSGIYIFGAQLSDSASLDPYVLNAAATPTAAAYYGARFYYDPVTLAPKGLLIEEQRANLLLNSSLAGTNLATQSVTVTAVAHTLSFYGTGTVTLTGTANTSLVGTGAYPTRSTLTFTPTAGVVLFTVTGTVQYAQLEIGSIATSFIPTAASQVTRTADVASIQGSNFYSWINQNAGSVYSQFVTPASGNRNIIALDDNTANNNIRLRTEGTDPYLKQAWVGTEQVALDLGTVAANTEYKISAAYQINDYAGVIANGTVGTDTVANTPIMVMLRLGTDQAGAYLNGTIKSLSYYPTRLNNDTLKGLTA